MIRNIPAIYAGLIGFAGVAGFAALSNRAHHWEHKEFKAKGMSNKELGTGKKKQSRRQRKLKMRKE